MKQEETVRSAPAKANVLEDELRLALRASRYELGKKIGSGGMGEVYEARHVLLDRPAAIKVLATLTATNRAQFLDEGRSLARLKHPHIVEIYDLDVVSGVPYMVMELLSGQTLEEAMTARGPLPFAEATDVIRQVLRGLGAAHATGLVHRDVKPANVFLHQEGERVVAKLLDFGISGRVGSAGLLIGTPRYFAPEQTRGDAVDPRTDLWATGVTFYRALTGKYPFSGESMSAGFRAIVEDAPILPRTHVPTIPPRLEAVVLRLLEKDPARRFQTAASAEKACHEALQDEPWFSPERQGYALIAVADPGRGAMAKTIVAERGLLGLHARNGDDALDMLVDLGMPDLMLVDASLPRLPAYELVAELRRMPGGSEVKVVAIATDPSLARTFARPAVDAVHDSWAPLGLQRLMARVLDGAPVTPEPTRAIDAAPRWPVMPEAPPTVRSRVAHAPRVQAAEAQVDEIAPPDEQLAQLVREVAESFGVSVALVSLVLPQRQWFKAHVGLGGALLKARGTPIEQSFCRHVVASGDPLVVEDAAHHPAFTDNELVREGVVGSYLGAPITTADGHVLGSLCIIDPNPHSFSERDVDDLAALARRAAGELALKTRPEAKLPVDAASDAAWELSPERVVLSVNEPLLRLFGGAEGDYVGRQRDDVIASVAGRFHRPDDALARLRVAADGPFMGYEDLSMDDPTRTIRWTAKPHVHATDGYRMEEAFQVVAPLADPIGGAAAPAESN